MTTQCKKPEWLPSYLMYGNLEGKPYIELYFMEDVLFYKEEFAAPIDSWVKSQFGEASETDWRDERTLWIWQGQPYQTT